MRRASSYEPPSPVRDDAMDSRYKPETSRRQEMSSRRSARSLRLQRHRLRREEGSSADLMVAKAVDESRRSRESNVSTVISSDLAEDTGELPLHSAYNQDDHDMDHNLEHFDEEYSYRMDHEAEVFEQNQETVPFWRRKRRGRDNVQGGIHHTGNANVSKATKRKRRIVIGLSLVFLGGMGGFVYWLYSKYGLWVFDNMPTNGNFTDGNSTSDAPTIAPVEGTNVSQDDSDDMGSETVPPSNDTATTFGIPSDFAEVCSREQVTASVWGMIECQAICRSVECCYFDVASNSSCFNSREEECLLYSPLCDVFYGSLPSESSTIMQAGAELADTCGSDNLQTNEGAKQCSGECYDGYCCFSSALSILTATGNVTTIPSCFEDNPIQCATYAPCLRMVVSEIHERQNVTVSPSSPPLPGSILYDICSAESLDTQAGFVHCTAECLLGECCMDTNPKTSCAFTQQLICPFYMPCLNLLERMSQMNTWMNDDDTTAGATSVPTQADANHTVVETPPDDIKLRCSEEALSSSTGPLLCYAACQLGECCFASGDTTTNCFSSNNETCELYRPCIPYWEKFGGATLSPAVDPGNNDDENLTTSGSPTQTPSAAPTDTEGDISSAAPSVEREPRGPTSTPSASIAVDLTITPTTQTPSMAPTVQSGTTMPSIRPTAGLTLVPSMAPTERATPVPSIATTAEPTFLPSEVPTMRKSSSPSAAPTSRTTVAPTRHATVSPTFENAPSAESEIERKCSVNAVDSPEGQLECAKLCLEGSCCFEEASIPSSCASQTAFCEYYAPCQNLVDALSPTQNIPVPSSPSSEPSSMGTSSAPTTAPSSAGAIVLQSDTERKCTLDLVGTPEGQLECAKACIEGSCCFQDKSVPGSCVSQTAFCDYYEPCQILLDSLSPP
jgi:hypothetical protein